MNKDFQVKLLLWGGGYPASIATLAMLKALETNNIKVSDAYCSSAAAPIATMRFIKKLSFEEIQERIYDFHITNLASVKTIFRKRSLVSHEDLLKEVTKYVDYKEHIQDGEETEVHLILFDKKNKTTYLKSRGDLVEYLADTMSFPGLVNGIRFVDGDLSKTDAVIKKISVQKEFLINLYAVMGELTVENLLLRLKRLPSTRASILADINLGYTAKKLSNIKVDEKNLMDMEKKMYNFLNKYFAALKANNFEVIDRELIMKV